MKNCLRMTSALALLCAALSTAMLASDDAHLYLVQGIPGRNISSSTDPAFPVDILLNDEVCYQRGLTFGTVATPLTLVAGSYDVKVSAANSLAPCSNSPLIDSTVSLKAGEDASAVVALSQTGNPTLLTFTNNVSPVAANMGRVLIAQAADAPALQVTLKNTVTMQTYTRTVNPGDLLDASLPAGTYTIEVDQGSTVFVAATPLTLFSQSATLIYAVGEASSNTVNVEIHTVRNVI